MFKFFRKRDKYTDFAVECGVFKYEELRAIINKLSVDAPERLKLLLKTPSKSGIYPLDYAFISETHTYESAILLLNYGADPYARLQGPWRKGETQLHKAIRQRNLGKIRLLILFNPNYADVLDREERITAREALREWDRSGPKANVQFQGRVLSAEEVAEMTVEASRKLAVCKERFRLAEERKDYAEAIYYCHELERMFKTQHELETSMPWELCLRNEDIWASRRLTSIGHYYYDTAKSYAHYRQQLMQRAHAEGISIVYEPSGSDEDPVSVISSSPRAVTSILLDPVDSPESGVSLTL